MSVSYESAMATLTGMFSEVDPEVVAMILQANKGHMEATVENLLAMTGQAAAMEGQQRQPPQPAAQPRASQPALNYVHPHHPSPSYPALGPAGPVHPGRRDSYSNEQKAGPQPPQLHQPMPPHPQQPPADPSADDVYRLPDDFLRGPSYFSSLVGPAPSNLIRQRVAGGGDGQLDVQSQIDQDHLLAQMLADEDFMRDLAQNPERYGNPGGQHPAPQVIAPPQGVLIRQGPLPQPHQPPMRAAPAPHPHSEREMMERRLSSANERPPQFAGANLEASASSSNALAAPLVVNSHSQLEPLNDKLRPLEEKPSSKHGVSPNKDQQSSFKLKWESLTSGAREKLARLSERLKNRKDRSDDGEGGEYQEMAELNENRVAPFGGGGNPNFLSASEAENLQNSYNSGGAKRIKNAFVDESDPFGRGANGSDDDDDGENNELGNYMAKRRESDEELKPLPRSSYKPPSFHMPGDAAAHDVILPGANDPAVRLNGIQPTSVILAPSQFQRPVGFASPSAIAAAGRTEKRRSLGSSGGQHPPPGISAPGDSDDDDEVSSPAAIARRVQKEKAGNMPLLSGNPPDL